MILSQASSIHADPLSDVMGALGAHGIRRTRLEASAPWGLSFAARDRLKFVAVLRGHGWAMLPGKAPVELGPGDVCLIGRTAYAIGSNPDVTLVDGAPLFEDPAAEVLRLGGADTVMLGGGIAFAGGGTAGFLFDALPPFQVLPACSGTAGAMAAVLAMLDREATAPAPGGALVSARLAEILLVEAIRLQAAAPAARPGWIAALADRQVGAALRLMHGHVARPWTVEALARDVGMSRSAFAARFLALVGRPPLDYLRHWRMLLARAALQAEHAAIAEVAERVGYGSHSAFAHAFRQSFGVPPGRVRRDGGPRLP